MSNVTVRNDGSLDLVAADGRRLVHVSGFVAWRDDAGPVYHVLHERELYPLTFWFTRNPHEVLPRPDCRLHPGQFDIRELAALQ